MITATIIADSIAPSGYRLTTMSLVLPRFAHAQLMTHRAFSRNASSSRAIPSSKMLAEIKLNPAMPVHWGLNQRGMQAWKSVDHGVRKACAGLWREAMRKCVKISEEMAGLGLHKQVANRVIEPWQHISVIVSSTDFENFFALRCHPDAQPEIHALAWEMADAYYESDPLELQEGAWHLPYVTEDLPTELALQCSVARCARVSFKNHDGSEPDVDKDVALYERLVKTEREDWEPGHMSPTEHQAKASSKPIRSGNFTGWEQYRKTLPMECMSFDYEWARKHWRNKFA